MLKGRRLGGCKFRRQHSVGLYVLDFYCPSESLGIELDGSVHDDPARRTYDVKRQEALEAEGIRVLRFENRTVLRTPGVVLTTISEAFANDDNRPVHHP